MINPMTNEEEKEIMEKMKRVINLQFRGCRQGKHTSRRTYKNIILAYAKYIVSKRGKSKMVMELDDIKAFLYELSTRNRSKSYISCTLSAIRYYVKRTHGKDSRLIHEIEYIKLNN